MKLNKIVFEAFVVFNIQLHKGLQTKSHLSKKIQTDKKLDKIEKSLSQEALLVKIAADWQFYILNIFSYCITLNSEKLQKELDLNLPSRMGFNNAYAILNGINFFTFRSADELIGLSKKYIDDSINPFIQIDKQVIKRIDELSILRNYIIHKSKNSEQRLAKFYSNNQKLKIDKDEFISPGEYLMRTYKDGEKEIQFSDSLIGILSMISIEIWKILDHKSYEFIFKEYDTLENSIGENPDIKNLEKLRIEFFRAVDKMNFVFEHLSK